MSSMLTVSKYLQCIPNMSYPNGLRIKHPNMGYPNGLKIRPNRSSNATASAHTMHAWLVLESIVTMLGLRLVGRGGQMISTDAWCSWHRHFRCRRVSAGGSGTNLVTAKWCGAPSISAVPSDSRVSACLEPVMAFIAASPLSTTSITQGTDILCSNKLRTWSDLVAMKVCTGGAETKADYLPVYRPCCRPLQ